MHSRGYVHHDLKPTNILIDGQGHCLIADFGACKSMRDGRLSCAEGAEVIVTREYAAPELLVCPSGNHADEAYYDETADIWSLGVVLGELLIGTVCLRFLFIQCRTAQRAISQSSTAGLDYLVKTFINA